MLFEPEHGHRRNTMRFASGLGTTAPDIVKLAINEVSQHRLRTTLMDYPDSMRVSVLDSAKSVKVRFVHM